MALQWLCNENVKLRRDICLAP
eukprot:COSAG04_NODE_13487_length_604_cov_0.893069_2_plen_21_part_01